jgi:3-oxoacyl-[acyl-carrier protein] reductase
VNAVLPGNILTEGLQSLGQESLKTMTASIPLKRLGTVEEIGHVAAFLAATEAAYITGQTIVVRWRASPAGVARGPGLSVI